VAAMTSGTRRYAPQTQRTLARSVAAGEPRARLTHRDRPKQRAPTIAAYPPVRPRGAAGTLTEVYRCERHRAVTSCKGGNDRSGDVIRVSPGGHHDPGGSGGHPRERYLLSFILRTQVG
jgi:hypothetical protein